MSNNNQQYIDLFKKVDTKTPTPFLTEISDDTFFKAMSNTPQAEPAAGPQPNVNPNPGGAGPIPGQTPPNGPGIGPNGPFATWNGQSNVKLNEILTGKVGITVLDAIIPALLVWLLATMADKKAKASQFTTTAQEKTTLEPIIERCMASLNINFENPWVALAVCASAIYGSKFLAVVTDENTPKIEKKPIMVAEPGGAVKKDGRGRPRKQQAA